MLISAFHGILCLQSWLLICRPFAVQSNEVVFRVSELCKHDFNCALQDCSDGTPICSKGKCACDEPVVSVNLSFGGATSVEQQLSNRKSLTSSDAHSLSADQQLQSTKLSATSATHNLKSSKLTSATDKTAKVATPAKTVGTLKRTRSQLDTQKLYDARNKAQGKLDDVDGRIRLRENDVQAIQHALAVAKSERDKAHEASKVAVEQMRIAKQRVDESAVAMARAKADVDAGNLDIAKLKVVKMSLLGGVAEEVAPFESGDAIDDTGRSAVN